MDSPPTYTDLGKAAKDIFSKGYGFGAVKIELKTRSDNGVMEFHSTGFSNMDTGKATGNLETKYKITDHSLTISQKWNTDNVLVNEVTVEDKLAKGLKIGTETSFVPNTGKKTGKLKTGYKCQSMNLACDVDLQGPIVHGSVVLGFEGWLGGYQTLYDATKSKPSHHNFALGFKSTDFQVHTCVNEGSEFSGSIYQKVDDKLETAITLAWTAGSNNTRFGVAGKYMLDKDTSLSAKVNNASLIGVGYTQSLRPGVKLTLSALIDGKNFNAGGHKLGLGFELDA
ncbi:voltage-dependent anion-selective channel protein 3-like isoform X1 [Xiphophorus maculatus]|uniref:voltage-dependent anion-selective channel protein 3-like isoform X1 n=1 Tax=Xiphophorus maculatus TaxID=8083 RepID=UPI0003B5748D|nr:voltage-dependent anion-selective channel protein 3-like isoform X1 [Xiphophorus maculatus]XP_027881844.1 voltage-dependent anion-selective channel protein 3-like isoform X1 [Xiphophorus couchianus]XP_032425190.1 voltage-dependent anion-selective channel protein 3-like isoform X3 [Xiphophorus hellerii]